MAANFGGGPVSPKKRDSYFGLTDSHSKNPDIIQPKE